MNATTHPSSSTRIPRLERTLSRLGRDYAYVVPGFVLSLVGFVLLVPIAALALGTAVIWVGVWLLPLALVMASGFAQLSRQRVRLWGGRLDQPRYRPAGSGLNGLLRPLADPRRWLDLLFETLIALPLRTATFCLAVTWTSVALGGVTYVLWGHYLPRDEEFPLVAGMLEALTDGAVPDALATSYAVESAAYFLLGAVFSLLLPAVMRGLALLDATTTAAALGAGPASGTPWGTPWGGREPAGRPGGADRAEGAGRAAARVA
jgi:hypothetical protein